MGSVAERCEMQPQGACAGPRTTILSHCGDDFDLDQGVPGKSRDRNRGAGWRRHSFGREVPGIDGVHGGEVGHVLQKDDGFDDVGEVGAGGGENRLDVLKDPGGLLGDGAGDDLAGGRIKGDLTGGVEEVAEAHSLRVGTDGRWSVGGGNRDLLGIVHETIVPGSRAGWQGWYPGAARGAGIALWVSALANRDKVK